VKENSGRVLVSLGRGDDESERAVPTAVELATRLGRRLELLTVVDDPDTVGVEEARLAAIAGGIDALELEATVVVADDVADAILDKAASQALVCMATDASLMPHKGHFGSIAEEVVRRIGRPVMLVGPKADSDITTELGRVVIPADGSKRAEAILGAGAELAAALGLTVWVVAVVSAKLSRAARRSVGPAVFSFESGYVRHLAELVTDAGGGEAQFEVLHDPDPADAILDFAGDDSLIAMSTHGRSGLARIFAGSVTTAVVAKTTRPVLVLRPPAVGE
jgi:nucleotide-binding universal stress UspA family protein